MTTLLYSADEERKREAEETKGDDETKALIALGILGSLAVYVQIRISGTFAYIEPDFLGWVITALVWAQEAVFGSYGTYVSLLAISYASPSLKHRRLHRNWDLASVGLPIGLTE